MGAYVIVTYTDQINVRAGPSQFSYNVIGVLLSKQTASAIGISPKTTPAIALPQRESTALAGTDVPFAPKQVFGWQVRTEGAMAESTFTKPIDGAEMGSRKF